MKIFNRRRDSDPTPDPLRIEIQEQYDKDLLTLGPCEAYARKWERVAYLDWLDTLGETQETLV